MLRPTRKVPWIRPIDRHKEPLSMSGVRYDCLLFLLEHDGIYLPVPEWGNNQYRYRCMSCYLHCGETKHVFATEYAKANDLKDGPTQNQQDQMSEHAKQHSIMWSWARSVNK